MPTDDLLEHAKSEQDFYQLLGEGVHPGSTEKELARAYRRSALKSHPDQNPDDPRAVERFHALQIAYDVLSDPAAKAAYNNARLAREARARQNELFEGKRRAMKEDLERRESGVFKRKRDDLDAEAALEREISRVAEDGRRRRKEREEALKRELEAQQKRGEEGEDVADTVQPAGSVINGGTGVPAISRTVKVRWEKGGAGESVDKDRLAMLFKTFGDVEDALILKDKKKRVGDDNKKRILGTGVIVFKSIVGAHAAVEDMKRQSDVDFKVFQTIEWAEGKEPDFLHFQSPPNSKPSEPPSTPQQASKKSRPFHDVTNSATSTPLSTIKERLAAANANGKDAGLTKKPSFASFSSAFNSPKGSPARGPQSPSLEEITLMRLKNAEKKRLEEQIRAQDAQDLGNP